jgi:hypothetical protein
VTLCPQASPSFLAKACSGVPPGADEFGVPQPANAAAALIVNCFFAPFGRTFSLGAAPARPSLPAFASGVGHEPRPLPDVRGADARSAQIRRPNVVARVFQVRENKVEPVEAVSARNLLAKKD